ncbi:MAG: HAMP domain-containing protein [Chloroflexi bacterium]|nr:HAMP domain-containing protein [Chloroflexota bacterium]
MVFPLANLYQNLGLQRRILLLVALGLAGILGLFAYLSLQAIQQSTDLVFQERLTLAQSLAGEMDSAFSDLQGQLEKTAPLLAASQEDPEATRIILHRLYQDLTGPQRWSAVGVSGLAWVNQGKGLVVAEPEGRLPPHGDWLGQPQVERALAQGKAAIAPARLQGEPSLALRMAVPGAGPQGQPGGILTADLYFLPQGLLWSTQEGRRTGYHAEVITGEGVIIAVIGPSTPVEQVGVMSHHYRLVAPMLTEGKPQVGVDEYSGSPDYQNPLVAFAPLKTLPGAVLLEQERDIALLLPDTLQRRLIFLGLVVFLAAMAAAWLTTRAVVKPVRGLIQASGAIAVGDFSQPISPSSNDEIGRLSATLEAMRLRLKTSQEELAAWSRELEQRVAQRTRELTALNDMAGIVASSLKAEEVLGRALIKVMQVTGASGGWVDIKDPETAQVKVVVAQGMAPREAGRHLRDCPCHQVFQSHQIVILHDTPEGDRLLCLPLASRDEVLGVMGLTLESGRQPSVEEERLLISLGQQMGVALENMALYEEVNRKEELRGQLIRKVITAQEEERKRLARELHDDLAQNLSYLHMSLDAAAAELSPDQVTLHQQMVKSRELAKTSLTEIRNLIGDLRPTVLDDLGLLPALRWYAQSRLGESGIAVDFAVDEFPNRLPLEVETALFRVMQEAVNNIARHSQARRVLFMLEADAHWAWGLIRDDGVGFSVRSVMRRGKGGQGLGLQGMKERIALLGGRLEIHSQPGKGTQVSIQVPLKDKDKGG